MAAPDAPEGEEQPSIMQDPLPPLQLEVTPEKPETRGEEDCSSRVEEDFGRPLDEIQLRTLTAKVDDLEQQLKERRQLHKLRKRHSSRLFRLTVAWVSLVWLVVLLQGFGQWFTPLFLGFSYIKFHLSDTVAVAFITSTTATVLGLYGIAAYWLFGKPKKDEAETPKKEK
ncbi:hypothetical protein [Pseudomonas kurunegalensis]|uniref:Uncharacterized protein n=1 Tax=Pseudomonas kurunegalensis TaxID=485880 RepID=A0ACC5UKQ9_9PSED|nr:hypothetical protein [Pseudomonas kurunegalensis]MBV4514935.1 hypothetical protein [Pseudomonas kurunegalensis]